MNIENHPLPPFIQEDTKLLMLGSFPPQHKRWSVEFYYPNYNNDMWRIFGTLFFNDKNYLVNLNEKCFDLERIVPFLKNSKIGIYDMAEKVRRLKDNASDKYLEIVEPTDIFKMLERIPNCEAIVTTGQKATDTLLQQIESKQAPKIGEYTTFNHKSRTIRFYRMPSSSRAYPLALTKKATFYQKMFQELKML